MRPLLTVVLVVATAFYIFVGGMIMHVLECDYEAATLSQISLLLDQATRRFLSMLRVAFQKHPQRGHHPYLTRQRCSAGFGRGTPCTVDSRVVVQDTTQSIRRNRGDNLHTTTP